MAEYGSAPRSGGSDRRSPWAVHLAPWAGPDDAASARQLLITTACYLASWSLLVAVWTTFPWLAPLAALPAAGFTVRLFIIAHDCGHGSYFTSKRLADSVAFVIGVLALTPHGFWRRCHAGHHAHAGKIDKRVPGDVPVLTSEEYLARSRLRRFLYRMVRHPVVLLGGATFLHFVIVHRCPLGMPPHWRKERRSVWVTNAVLAAFMVSAALAGVFVDYVVLHGIVMYWACALAGWITHSQHQCEHAYWRLAARWSFADAALLGSSYLRLPRWLAWLTADIGVHHVHHLLPRIPNYRLRACHDAFEEFSSVRQIGWRETFPAYRYIVWDERLGRMTVCPS